MSAEVTDALVHDGEARRVVLELGKSDHRVRWIDGARGLSIVAMIVSHFGMVTGVTPGWFHLYLMRPFAPMFLLLLGMLWRPGWRPRHWQLVAGAVASQAMAWYVGFAVPNIMLVILAVVLLMPLTSRYPHATIALCVTQLLFWPMPGWWTGYDPGFAIAIATAGHVIPADGLVRAFGRFGDRLGLGVIGRRPMTWYLGHLVVLSVLLTLVRAS